jgi:hypothetical protein
VVNLFDNPINAFAPPYSFPVIPVFLFSLMGVFVPYWTASNAIVLGCFFVRRCAKGVNLRSVCGLPRWRLTQCGTTGSH